jgi:hypothetical protein
MQRAAGRKHELVTKEVHEGVQARGGTAAGDGRVAPIRGAMGAAVRLRSRRDSEIGSLFESAEVVIAGEQSNPMIYTSLCNQGVSQARLSSLSENSRSQDSCTFPETSLNVEQRQAGKRLRHAWIQFGVAQQFREDHRNHNDQLVAKSTIQQVRIVTAVSLQECDPGARVRRDHRSVFNSAAVREN